MDWLRHLKAGDTVIVQSGMGGIRPAKVDRVTATQVVVGNARYKRQSGRMIGGSVWSRNNIYEATPEMLAKAVSESARAYLGAVRWNHFSDADVTELARLAREREPKS